MITKKDECPFVTEITISKVINRKYMYKRSCSQIVQRKRWKNMLKLNATALRTFKERASSHSVELNSGISVPKFSDLTTASSDLQLAQDSEWFSSHHMNQSHQGEPCYQRNQLRVMQIQPMLSASDQVMVGFVFAYDWLRIWREVS